MPRNIRVQDRLAIFTWQRNLAQFFLGGFYGSGWRIFAANTMNLIFGYFQRREQQFVGHLEVAFRVIGRDTTLIRPEKMDVARKGWRAAVPDFSRLCPFNERREKFLRDAPAGQRDAM